MNTNSPLVPQGTTPPRGKSSLYFKVLMILTVHVVLIGGMLLQGCKDIPKDTAKENSSSNAPELAGATNTPQETMPPMNINTLSNNQATAASSPSQPSAAPQPAPLIQPPATLSASAPPMTSAADYVVASGDTFGVIAKRQHVSLRALMEANPGVDAKKLRVGQKIQIPAGTGAVAAGSATAATETASADGSVYVVKTGDTLGKIARLHGTSYKKLMAVNDLKSTSIHVGQKLKMPAPKPAGAEVIPASASTAQPQTGAAASPAPTTAAPGAAN